MIARVGSALVGTGSRIRVRRLCAARQHAAREPASSGVKGAGISQATDMAALLSRPNKEMPSNTTTEASGLVTKSFAMMKMFYRGSLGLWNNVVKAHNLKKKASSGRELSHSDRLFMSQTTEDKRRLRLFFFLYLLLPESIPFVITMMPSLMPSTYEDDVQKEAREVLQETKAVAQAVACLNIFLGSSSAEENAIRRKLVDKMVESNDGFQSIGLLLEHMRAANNPELRAIKDLPRPVLELLCIAFHQPTFGPVYFLRRRIDRHLQRVAALDEHIGSIVDLSQAEVEAACRLRGLTGTRVFKSENTLREALSLWVKHVSAVDAKDRTISMVLLSVANVFFSVREHDTLKILAGTPR